MTIIKPYKNIAYREIGKKSIYLAGSVDGENWRSFLDKELSNMNYIVFNPLIDKKEDYVESLTNPQFCQQKLWESTCMAKSDYIVFYFNPNTKASISLLELGLWVREKPMVVCCPEGYWKKGDVDYVCQSFDIPQVEGLETLLSYFEPKQ